MTAWRALSLAARLAPAPRRDEIAALLAFRAGAAARPAVVLATPRRFVSLRKLLKPNAAIDAMLRVMHHAMAEAQARGLSYDLRLSDRPTADQAQPPCLYLSHHTIQTPAFDQLAAQGTTVRHFKAADIPDHTVIDPRGFAGWSSLADARMADLDLGTVDAAQVDAFYQATQTRLIQGNLSKYAQSDGRLDLPQPYVFVALQTIGDMVQRNAYIPMLDMLALVVARFRDSGTQVVVKRHPKCRSRRVARALHTAAQEPHVTITDGSIHRILSGASAVFTVNSGVGGESLVHDAPLYCFGKADYAAVAHQVRTASDLTRLTTPLRPAVSASERRRFLYYYRNIYQMRHPDQLGPRLGALIDAACR